MNVIYKALSIVAVSFFLQASSCSTTGAVIGGLAGGSLCHKNNCDVERGVITGSLTGALIGDHIDQQRNPRKHDSLEGYYSPYQPITRMDLEDQIVVTCQIEKNFKARSFEWAGCAKAITDQYRRETRAYQEAARAERQRDRLALDRERDQLNAERALEREVQRQRACRGYEETSGETCPF